MKSSDPHPEEVARWAKGGSKILNDFIVDLFGSLVPGIIFLFSILFCLVIPVALLFFSYISISSANLEALGRVFDNWFWVISFLTFLILAYAVGNIFYRLDIKEVDKESFKKMSCKHFKNMVLPMFEPYFEGSSSVLKKLKVRYVGGSPRVDDDFIVSFKELFCDQLCVFNSDNCKADKTKLQDLVNALLNTENAGGDLEEKEVIELLMRINNLSYILYQERDKNLSFDVSRLRDEDYAERLLNKDFTKHTDILSKRLSSFMSDIRSYLNGEAEKYKKQEEKGKEEGNEEGNEDEMIPSVQYLLTLTLGWYYLFSLRAEQADDNENCQFPYTYYAEYLIKRDAMDLVPHVKWKDKNSRSKNGLNRLKFRIQLAAPKEYNILVKNEAHIRMASSSWGVAKYMFYVGSASFILLFIIMGGAKLLNIESTWNAPSLFIILLLPVIVLVFNWFIYTRVKEFIHYQRLREIFTAVLTYNYLFVDGIHKWYAEKKCTKVDEYSVKEEKGDS